MPWIDPLWHLITAIGNHTFYIRRDGCPLSGREIDLMLSDNKISHHGMLLDLEGDICLNVAKGQAQDAQRLFDQYGVEVLNPVEVRKAKRPPPRRASRGSPFDVFDIFD